MDHNAINNAKGYSWIFLILQIQKSFMLILGNTDKRFAHFHCIYVLSIHISKEGFTLLYEMLF